MSYKSPISKLFDGLDRKDEEKYSNPYVDNYRSEDTSYDVSSSYLSGKSSREGYENFNMGTYNQYGFGKPSTLYDPVSRDFSQEGDNPYESSLNKIDTYSRKLNELGLEVPELDKVDYGVLEGIGDLSNIFLTPINPLFKVANESAKLSNTRKDSYKQVLESDEFKSYIKKDPKLEKEYNEYMNSLNTEYSDIGAIKLLQKLDGAVSNLFYDTKREESAFKRDKIYGEAKKFVESNFNEEQKAKFKEDDSVALESLVAGGKSILSNLTGLVGKNVANLTDNKELMEWYRENEGGLISTLGEMRKGTYGEDAGVIPQIPDTLIGETVGQLATPFFEEDQRAEVKQAIGQFGTDFIASAFFEGKIEVDDAGKALSYMKNIRNGKIDDINKAVDSKKALDAINKAKKVHVDDIVNKSQVNEMQSFLKNTDEVEKLRELGDDGKQIIDELLNSKRAKEELNVEKYLETFEGASRTKQAEHLLRKTKDFLGDYDFDGVKYFGQTIKFLDKANLEKIAKNDKLYRATQIGLTMANPFALPYSALKGSTLDAMKRLKVDDYKPNVGGSIRKKTDEALATIFDKVGGGKNSTLKRLAVEDYSKALDSIATSQELARQGFRITNQIQKNIENFNTAKEEMAKKYGKSIDDINEEMMNVRKVIENPTSIVEKKGFEIKIDNEYKGSIVEAKKAYISDLRKMIGEQRKLYDDMYKGKSPKEKLSLMLKNKDKLRLTQYLSTQESLLESYEKILNSDSINVSKQIKKAFGEEKFLVDGKDITKQLMDNPMLSDLSKIKKKSVEQIAFTLRDKHKLGYDTSLEVANKYKAVVDSIYKTLEDIEINTNGATITQRKFDLDKLIDDYGVEDVKNVESTPNLKSQNLENRTLENIKEHAKDTKIKTIANDFPELKEHIYAGARGLDFELRNSTIKGESENLWSEDGEFLGRQVLNRKASESVIELLSMNMTYDDIQQGIDDLLNGKNTAKAKRVEAIIDRDLTKGATTVEGDELPINEDYVNLKKKLIKNKTINGINIKEPIKNTTKTMEKIQALKDKMLGLDNEERVHEYQRQIDFIEKQVENAGNIYFAKDNKNIVENLRRYVNGKSKDVDVKDNYATRGVRNKNDMKNIQDKIDNANKRINAEDTLYAQKHTYHRTKAELVEFDKINGTELDELEKAIDNGTIDLKQTKRYNELMRERTNIEDAMNKSSEIIKESESLIKNYSIEDAKIDKEKLTNKLDEINKNSVYSIEGGIGKKPNVLPTARKFVEKEFIYNDNVEKLNQLKQMLSESTDRKNIAILKQRIAEQEQVTKYSLLDLDNHLYAFMKNGKTNKTIEGLDDIELSKLSNLEGKDANGVFTTYVDKDGKTYVKTENEKNRDEFTNYTEKDLGRTVEKDNMYTDRKEIYDRIKTKIYDIKKREVKLRNERKKNKDYTFDVLKHEEDLRKEIDDIMSELYVQKDIKYGVDYDAKIRDAKATISKLEKELYDKSYNTAKKVDGFDKPNTQDSLKIIQRQIKDNQDLIAKLQKEKVTYNETRQRNFDGKMEITDEDEVVSEVLELLKNEESFLFGSSNWKSKYARKDLEDILSREPKDNKGVKFKKTITDYLKKKYNLTLESLRGEGKHFFLNDKNVDVDEKDMVNLRDNVYANKNDLKELVRDTGIDELDDVSKLLEDDNADFDDILNSILDNSSKKKKQMVYEKMHYVDSKGNKVYPDIAYNKYTEDINELKGKIDELKAKISVDDVDGLRDQTIELKSYEDKIQELAKLRKKALDDDWRIVRTKDGYKFTEDMYELRTNKVPNDVIEKAVFDAKAMVGNKTIREVVEKRSTFDFLEAYVDSRGSRLYTNPDVQIDGKKVYENPIDRNTQLTLNEASDYHARFTSRAKFKLSRFKDEVLSKYPNAKPLADKYFTEYLNKLTQSKTQMGLREMFGTPELIDNRGTQLDKYIEIAKQRIEARMTENVKGTPLRKMVNDKEVLTITDGKGVRNLDQKLTKKQLNEALKQIDEDVLEYGQLTLTKDIGSEGKRVGNNIFVDVRGNKLQVVVDHEIAHIMDNFKNRGKVEKIVTEYFKRIGGLNEKEVLELSKIFNRGTVSGGTGNVGSIFTNYLKELSDTVPSTREGQIFFEREQFAELMSVALTSNAKKRDKFFGIMGNDFKNSVYDLITTNRDIKVDDLIPKSKTTDMVYRKNIERIKGVLEETANIIRTYDDVKGVEKKFNDLLEQGKYFVVEKYLKDEGRWSMPEGKSRLKVIETDERITEIVSNVKNLDDASRQMYEVVTQSLRDLGIDEGIYNRVDAILKEYHTYLPHLLRDELKESKSANRIYDKFFGGNKTKMGDNVKNVYANQRKYHGNIDEINKELSRVDELLAKDIKELLETNLEKMFLKRNIDSSRILQSKKTQDMLLNVFGENYVKFDEFKNMFVTKIGTQDGTYGTTKQITKYDLESARQYLIDTYGLDPEKLDTKETAYVKEARERYEVNSKRLKEEEGIVLPPFKLQGVEKSGDRLNHYYKILQEDMYEKLQSGEYELVKINNRMEETSMKALDLSDYEDMLNVPERSESFNNEVIKSQIAKHKKQISETLGQQNALRRELQDNKHRIDELIYDENGNKRTLNDEQLAEWANIKDRNSYIEEDLHNLEPVIKELTSMSEKDMVQAINNIINDFDAVGKLNVLEHSKLKDVEVFKEIDDGAYLMPKRVVKMYESSVNIQNKKNANAFAQAYQKITQLFKASALLTPQFHFGNEVTNELKGFCDIGIEMFNPKRIKQASIINNLETGRFDKYKKMKIKTGQTYEQVYRTFVELGGKDTNRMTDHFDRLEHLRNKSLGKTKNSPIEKLYYSKANPLNPDTFVPYEVSQNIGDQIESNSRLRTYIYHLEQGRVPQEAMDLTNNNFFDYSDLTEFETETLKNIVPFYTFLKKNIAVQFENLANKPKEARLTALLYEVGENQMSEEDKRIAPEYLSNTSIPIGDGYYFKTNTAFGSFAENITNPKSLLSGLNPIIKSPMEAILNKSFFNDAEVSRYDKTSEKLWHVAGSVFPMVGQGKNVYNSMFGDEYKQGIAEQKLKEQWLLQRVVDFDREQATKQMLDNYADELNDAYFSTIKGKDREKYEQMLEEIEAMKEAEKRARKRSKGGLFD